MDSKEDIEEEHGVVLCGSSAIQLYDSRYSDFVCEHFPDKRVEYLHVWETVEVSTLVCPVCMERSSELFNDKKVLFHSIRDQNGGMK